MQITKNKFYQTDEFEVSFLHYLILSNQDQTIINMCMDKFPELLNDNNNKYKLYPIHCAFLRNNLNTYKEICIRLHKPYVDIPSKNKKTIKNMFKKIEEKPDSEKLIDDIVDVYGNNMLEFCLLNNCCLNILKMLTFNYKYNVLQKYNGENIIIKAIRVENQEFINVLTQLGYDINFGIINFVQMITGRY